MFWVELSRAYVLAAAVLVSGFSILGACGDGAEDDAAYLGSTEDPLKGGQPAGGRKKEKKARKNQGSLGEGRIPVAGSGDDGTSSAAGALAAAGSGGDGAEIRGDNACLAGITNYAQRGKFQFTATRSGSVNLWVPRVPAGCKVPIVHLSNGTGATCAGYRPILEHLASHGFLSSCYESTNTGSGSACMTALETSYAQYPQLADDLIGSTGHSQGGGAAVTCVYLAETKWGTRKLYAAAAMEPAHGMNRSTYTREYPRIRSPIFMFSGSQDTVVSESWVGDGYSLLTSEKYWYEATGATHVPIPTSWTQESAVAFFRWKLLGDVAAGNYFRALPASNRWDLKAQSAGK